MLGKVALLARLASQGLVRTYKFFAALMLAEFVLAVGLFLFAPDPQSAQYAWAYVASLPVLAVLRVLVILELYSLVLRNHPGIERFGQWVVSGGLLAAVAIAVITLFPDFSNTEQDHVFLLYASIFERAISSALLLFLALITAFLVWFPVPLSRNTVLHSFVFAVFFLSNSVLLLIRNIVGLDIVRTVSTVNLAVGCACYLTWCLFLTRAGEKRRVTVGHRWDAEGEERLARQLNSVNETLMRVVRK